MKNKWACIINPVAGGGYAGKNLKYIEENVKAIDSEAPIILTERPGHASEITENLVRDGYDTILVAGGDGTVHEVGSVLVGKSDIALGIISAGTGNDYNFMAGFPERFDNSHWKSLKKRTVTPFDVGICNDQYFFNGMGLGFDAAMTAKSVADREKTGKTGKGRYTWIIVKTLVGYKGSQRQMLIDDKEQRNNSFLTTIAIGRRFAGSYHLTPKALVDDGLLDICDISPLGLAGKIKILMKVPKGTHLKHSAVNYHTCRTCRLEFDEDVPAHLDGELIYDNSFNISIKEKSLNILTHGSLKA